MTWGTDQTDERDDAAERDGGAGEQGDDDDRADPQRLDVDPEVAGVALAEREQVVAAAEDDRHDRAGDRDQHHDAAPRPSAIRRASPSCQNTICSRLPESATNTRNASPAPAKALTAMPVRMSVTTSVRPFDRLTA